MKSLSYFGDGAIGEPHELQNFELDGTRALHFEVRTNFLPVNIDKGTQMQRVVLSFPFPVLYVVALFLLAISLQYMSK